MTEPAAHFNGKSSDRSGLERRSLNFHETYICPVCRHGQIAELTLMDAFACNFCRHIFTANLREQSIHVEDSSQPMTWRWNGRNWQGSKSARCGSDPSDLDCGGGAGGVAACADLFVVSTGAAARGQHVRLVA